MSAKPVYILSGFLGSGKTTLLNRLLKQKAFANTLVIINEFGQISLDHLLVEKSSDTILELSNGCLCCSIRGELIDTLLQIQTKEFDRVIIETTGIADPLPIFQSLAFHPELSTNFKPAEIITVFDCQRGEKLIMDHSEAMAQIVMADIIIPTKQDLVQDRTIPIEEIRKLNETALVLDHPDDLDPEIIHQRTARPQGIGHNHTHGFTSQVLETHSPVSISTLSGLLHHLSNTLGANLLRIKGFALTQEYPHHPVLVQVSGQIVHDFEKREHWSEVPATRLVVIAKNTQAKEIKTIFDGFMNTLAIDTPDKKAMTENPLSIPGFEI